MRILFPALAEFAKEKGWHCGNSFISWRSKCYTSPVSGQKRYRTVINPRTGRKKKEAIGLNYQEYRKRRSQAIQKQGRGQALTAEEREHIKDAQRLALKTRKGVQRRGQARTKRSQPSISSPTPTPQISKQADSWGKLTPQEKRNHYEADITPSKGGVFEVNIVGDKISDPEKGKGSYLVVNSRQEFEDAFKDFVFEKPSPQEVLRQKDRFVSLGWKGRVFDEDSPKRSISNGFSIPSYISKDKLAQWQRQSPLKLWGGEDEDKIIPAQESRGIPTGRFSVSLKKRAEFSRTSFGHLCLPPKSRERKRGKKQWDLE